MKIDSSVDNFIAEPNNYILKVEKQKDNSLQFVAEKKGPWTWIKAHVGTLFGVYKLEAVYEHLRNFNTDSKSDALKGAANKVITKWNMVHDKQLILLQSIKQPSTNSIISQNKLDILAATLRPDSSSNTSQKSKVSYDVIMSNAKRQFARHPLKEKILQNIENNLKGYDSSPESKPTTITLGRMLTRVSASKEQKEIEQSTIDFFAKNTFPGIRIEVLE